MSAAFLLWTGLLLAQTDAGYVRHVTPEGHCLHWPVTAPTRGSVTFVQSAAGDPAVGPADVFDAVTRAAGSWQAEFQRCGNLDLLEGPRSASRTIGYTLLGANENLVLVRTRNCADVVLAGDPCHSTGSCGNAYDCWDGVAGSIALTFTTYFLDGGVLVDADIEIDGATHVLSVVDAPPCPPGVTQNCVATDVRNAATHEFGYFLGLDPSPDPASTMFLGTQPGDLSKRVLDPGSRQFVCDVYPAGRSSQDCVADGTGSGGGGGGGSGGTGLGNGGGPGIGSPTSGCSTAADEAPCALLLLALVALGGRWARPGGARLRLRDRPSQARTPSPRPRR